MANLSEVARAVEKRAAHKLARGTVTLPLPLYDGQYLGRFGVLDGERLAAFENVEEDPEASIEAAAEFVSDACRCILARPEGGGKPERLTHEDGRPVRFDEDFAKTLELEPAPDRGPIESMADVVFAVWTVEDLETGERALSYQALNRFALRLLSWMQDTSRLVEGELVGESNGARP